MTPRETQGTSSVQMLGDLTVVELGDSIVSAAAGAMLRRFGANVRAIRTEGRVDGKGTQRDRLLRILDHDKATTAVRSLWDPSVLDHAADADITIAYIGDARHLTTPDVLRAYEDRVRGINAGSWVTVSPFGLHGPLSVCRGAEEITSLGAGGIAHYMRSSAGRPMKPAGFTGSITAGHFAALAGVHGALRVRQGHGPQHLDLSMQDAVVATGVFLECAHSLFECAGEGGSARYASPRGFVRCGTGMIWILVIEDHHWAGCLRALGDPAWSAGIKTRAEREEHRSLIHEQLEEWAAQYSAQECAKRLQDEGVPATPVNSCADLLAGGGLDVRANFFEDVLADERVPGMPVDFGSRRGATHGTPATSTAPNRYRVLDIGQVLVVPLAASWLGAMGVDVLKVEDLDRTDIYRRHGPFLEDTPGHERSAYFSFVNYSKRSHAVRLGTERGRARLAALIESSDVVMSNLSPHRAASLGLTPTAMSDSTGSVLVSCSGFGRSTAHAGYRAYGMNIQAAGGVVHLSRDRTGRPVNVGTSWADPLTSVWLAVSTLSLLMAPPDRRNHADVSMVEVVAYELPEYFAELSAQGVETAAEESRLDHAAPHGFYQCAGDDRWLAIAVGDDEEWRCLVEAVGRPAELADPAFDAHADRLARQDDLDAALDRVLSRLDRDVAFGQLQRGGVPCAPVWGARELLALEHLQSRGLFQEVDHAVWGPRALVGLPWRTVGEGPIPIAPPPLLGEHTHEDPARWWI